MASEDEESKDAGGGRGDPAPPPGTRIPWVIMAVFVVVALGAGLAIGKKNLKAPHSPGSRAILISNADHQIKVVVPPCGTKFRATAQNVPEQLRTQGVTNVAMPKAEGQRILVVPRCPGATISIPSAIYVLTPGSPTPTAEKDVGGLGSIRSLLVVPDGTPLATVVVPPCDRALSSVRKSVVLSSTGTPPDTAAAPRC